VQDVYNQLETAGYFETEHFEHDNARSTSFALTLTATWR